MRSLPLFIALSLALSPPAARAEGELFASAACSGSSITVSWSYHEDIPAGLPQWIGYDVYRKTISPCGPLVRINPGIVPRDFSGNHSRQFVDDTPAASTSYQYEVWPVDANHVLVALPQCYNCTGIAVSACPSFGDAAAHGSLEDLGWAFYIHPCPDNCSPAFTIDNHLDELRPYVGTGTVLRLFGTVGCGSIEGCILTLDHFEVADCGPVPALPKTWGSVKASYR